MLNLKRIIKHEDDIYIFLTATYYHLLYSLIMISFLGIKDKSIFIFKNQPDYILTLAMKMEANGYHIEKWGNFIDRSFTGRVKYYFTGLLDQVYIKHIKRANPNKNFVIMNFLWNIKHIYYGSKAYFDKCDRAFFFEEGANCYCNYTGNNIELFIKKIIGDDFSFYNNRKLKTIFVTSPEKYPDYLQNKIAKLDIFELWDCIDKDDKEKILKLFISDTLYENLLQKKNFGIVYTQPLSEDGYISEEEKIKTYREICRYYSKYGQILLKPHPRDTSEYSFQGIEVIDRLWPSEVLSLFGIKFIFSIGICTSAVTGTDALIKLNLNENYLSDHKLDMIPLNMGDIQ